jgi:hypothetical protein
VFFSTLVVFEENGRKISFGIRKKFASGFSSKTFRRCLRNRNSAHGQNELAERKTFGPYAHELPQKKMKEIVQRKR